MTEQSRREFFHLVVEKETTKCWSWLGAYEADGRPVFRGEKAYRIMYQLRIGVVPAGFHVHHKCENSACVNPRHLVALSPEAHRAVHATKDKSLKERIYRGEWERIQAEKAQAQWLAKERAERQRLEREQQRRAAEIERQRTFALAAEEERKKQLRREQRMRKLATRSQRILFYGSLAFVCGWFTYRTMQSFPSESNPWAPSVVIGLVGLTLLFFCLAIEDD